MRKVLFWALLALLCFGISSCYIGRAIIWNVADVGDMNKFKSRTVARGEETCTFFQRPGPMAEPEFPPAFLPKDYGSFEAFMKESHTVALLIIRNDTVLFENYWHGRDAQALHPGFSVAKSFVSALVGIAIDEGKIGGVDDPLTKYLPELKKPGTEKITLDHLLQMRSGIAFKEQYFNPFGMVATYYYGRNIGRLVKKTRTDTEPGSEFRYLSVATQLLAIATERATGMHIDQYLQEKIWIPLGMESDATWNIDSRKHGMAKAYCCLNATARDFAKFGRLYLNMGKWNGKQIIPRAWVERSIMPYSENQKSYSSQWWLLEKKRYAAIGILGQFVVVDPATSTIIVRLGEKHGDVNWKKLAAFIIENYR
jgi:CubicO group peptidase (beta-lactamase class C family)